MSGSGRRTTCPGLAVAPYGRIVSRLGAVGRRPAPGSWLPGLRRILRPPRPRAVTPKPCSSGLVTAPPWRPAERRSPQWGAARHTRRGCKSACAGAVLVAKGRRRYRRALSCLRHLRALREPVAAGRRPLAHLLHGSNGTASPGQYGAGPSGGVGSRCPLCPSVRAAVRLLGPLGGPQGRTPLVALLGNEEGRRRRSRSGIRRSRCRSDRSDRRGETAYGLACECLGFIQRNHAGVNTEAASALGVVQPRVATGHKQQLLPSGAQGERLGDLVRPQGTDGVPDRQQRQGTDKGREWTP